MAERRMFAKKITESDAFLDMPSSTQMLYFHLSMNADDDGFVNNPKKIQRMCGASDDDFKLLIAKSFVILFESGVIVIKHWKMHNYIQSDRYRPTDYVDEKSMLGLKKNKAYTLDGNQMYTRCIQDVSVGKVREDKDSIDKDKKENTKGSSLDFDFESAFEQTFAIYPKKTAYTNAKTTWMDKLLGVIEENRPDIARLIYTATAMYLDDYRKKHSDDAEYKFIPKYVEWLKSDCDYWLKFAEKRE